MYLRFILVAVVIVQISYAANNLRSIDEKQLEAALPEHLPTSYEAHAVLTQAAQKVGVTKRPEQTLIQKISELLLAIFAYLY